MYGYPIWFCLALLLACLLGVSGGCALAFAFASGRIKRRQRKSARKEKRRGLRSRIHQQDSTSFSAFQSFERDEDHGQKMHAARGSQDDSYAYISRGDRSK